MNSFFSLLVPESVTQTPLETPREMQLDLSTLQVVIINGQISIVEGLEAIKIWIYKTLRTQRFRYDAYSWDFGHEVESLVGSGLSRDTIKSESSRMVKEALFINPHITNVREVEVAFEDSKMLISCVVETNYGEVRI